jgi:3-dehydroquinate synthase
MIISNLQTALKPHLDATHDSQLFVLVDSNTYTCCLPILLEFLEDRKVNLIVIPAGEASKNLSVVQQIWDELHSRAATREALLLNLGGGMITDLGGFAAATYMRGIRCVNLPTSLLAMVDASHGGKTGVNFKSVKNLIGCFSVPEDTVLYLPFLETLPIEEWLSGYAEMLKHALLKDREHWYALLNVDWNDKYPISTDILEVNMQVKSSIVTLDPEEKGMRKMLNFGHTIGHAIEESYASQGRKVCHGYCVMWGMVAELYLSVLRLGCPRDVLVHMSNKMIALYGRPDCNCRHCNELIEWMKRDKKNQVCGKNGDIAVNFTLLHDVGNAHVDQYVGNADLEEALEYLFSL